MRIDLAELLRPHAREPQEVILPPAPLAGLRGQRLQRLQVGVFGLAAMVLLVGLANIIKTNAEHTEAQVVAEAVPTARQATATEASDPLADAGVVPGMPERETDRARGRSSGNAAPPPVRP